ncbi:MAG: hypothetical protein L6Q37_15055 [Bdellovibrionaceae bacterium]|nr:hypothetical protein [Pseudobdellovibrionaceae bacterium]
MATSPGALHILSFRSYLQLNIATFIKSFKDSETIKDLLSELILLISSYQEEGTKLFPAVFLAQDLKELMSLTHSKNNVPVGHGAKDREHLNRAFRQCAPLAESREWAVYFIASESQLHYGIFLNDLSPLSPTPFERLRQAKSKDSNIVGISKLGGNFIELRANNGEFQYLNLMGDSDESANPPKLIRNFTKHLTSGANEEIKSHLELFYYRVGVNILHATHGTLVAVVNKEYPVPEIFHDGIILDKPILISAGIAQFLASNNIEDFQKLLAWNHLLSMMTGMDGITVLNTEGSIIAYNCFIKNSLQLQRTKDAVLGGARKRAFSALCKYLNHELAAVLYKSQDGHIELGASEDRLS